MTHNIINIASDFVEPTIDPTEPTIEPTEPTTELPDPTDNSSTLKISSFLITAAAAACVIYIL